jgi:large subunit ribosomal protein L29
MKKLEKDKKWKWPADKMREWTDAELKTREREFADQLFRLKFQMAGGQSEHVTAVRELRKGVAKVKTLRRERELGATKTEAGAR